MGFLGRMSNMWSGFLSLFVGRLEEKNPEAVYESVINQRVLQYQKLMKAVSGIVYLRNKIQKELEEKSNQLKEVQKQLPIAIQQGDDEISVILIEKKNYITTEVERLTEELDKISKQAEESKDSLITFQADIEKLKTEKVSMLVKRENAITQKRIQEQLSSLSIDADIKALSSVREGINKLEAEVQINKEISSVSLDSKLKSIKNKTSNASAKNELEELKKQMTLKQSEKIKTL